MCTGLGELRWPHSHVRVLGLMDSHVWWPDSVMDLTLAEVPLLEEVTSVLLMCGVHLRQVDHPLLELHLSETLVDKKIVLLVDSSVATLASSREDLETATKSVNKQYKVSKNIEQTRRVKILSFAILSQMKFICT